MRLKKMMTSFCLAMLLLATCVQAQAAQEVPTITVQGSNQLDVTPDVAYIQMAVVSSAVTVGEAQKQNAFNANQAYAALEAAGIGRDYVKTTQYSVVPLYEQADNGKNTDTPAIRGYQIINGFKVTVAPERVGEIIDLALSSGVNQMQEVHFGKLDETSVKNAALQMAVKDAMGKAEAMAAALGKRIIRIQSVSESGVYVQMPEMVQYSKSMDYARTPVSPGYVHLNANVQMVVEME